MRKARVIGYVLAAGCAIGLMTVAATTGSMGAAPSQRTADQHGWMTYVNVRFQYSICYPADLLVSQGEAANSDGQRFLSSQDGAELAAYGSNNALDETLRQRQSDMQSRLAGASGKVTYRAQKANWFVVSGQSGETIFYAKTIYSHGQFKSFELTYDRSAAALYDPVVARLAACFTDLVR